MTEEIGEWLIYNKSSLIKDMSPFVRMVPNINVQTTVTALLKNLALSYKGESFTAEDILVAFSDETIIDIIKKHYVREYLHD